MAYQVKIACFESVTADTFVMDEETGVQIYHKQNDCPTSSLLAIYVIWLLVLARHFLSQEQFSKSEHCWLRLPIAGFER